MARDNNSKAKSLATWIRDAACSICESCERYATKLHDDIKSYPNQFDRDVVLPRQDGIVGNGNCRARTMANISLLDRAF